MKLTSEKGIINMKLSFSTLACPDFEWTDIYSIAKDFHFDGIEIRGYFFSKGKAVYRFAASEHSSKAKEPES